MRQIIKLVIVLILVNSFLYGAPARGGLITFTQPDGSTFQGLLKGDSSFHWIESNSQIVLYNPKDKFYYNAIITKEKNFALTNVKAGNSLRNSPSKNARATKQNHRVSTETQTSLYKMSQKVKEGSHPR